MKKFDIREHLKKNPFVLAPMDMATDICFRELCEEQGASFSVTELCSVDALVRDKTPKYRYSRGNLKINSVQLFGKDPEVFVEALKKVEDEADIIDVNFGCPSNTVVGNGGGSSLLRNPKLMGEIVSALVRNTNLPVSAKIRIGFSNKELNYKEIVSELEAAGVSFITVHGRTKAQKYTGKADWDVIREIYDSSSVPIIGNGDICCEEDVDRYLGTHCDGLMIGRAAIGNPFLFKRLLHYYRTGERLEFERREVQKKLFSEYIRKVDDVDFYKKELKIRQQGMWFMKGIEGAKDLRKRIVHEDDVSRILVEVEKF